MGGFIDEGDEGGTPDWGGDCAAAGEPAVLTSQEIGKSFVSGDR